MHTFYPILTFVVLFVAPVIQHLITG